VVLALGAEKAATAMSLTALMDRVHSDGVISPGWKYFLLMRIEYNMAWQETGWEWETVNVEMIQYAVHAVLSVCCTRCMLYSVYALLGVNS
jgi:hypothetical protein